MTKNESISEFPLRLAAPEEVEKYLLPLTLKVESHSESPAGIRDTSARKALAAICRSIIDGTGNPCLIPPEFKERYRTPVKKLLESRAPHIEIKCKNWKEPSISECKILIRCEEASDQSGSPRSLRVDLTKSQEQLAEDLVRQFAKSKSAQSIYCIFGPARSGKSAIIDRAVENYINLFSATCISIRLWQHARGSDLMDAFCIELGLPSNCSTGKVFNTLRSHNAIVHIEIGDNRDPSIAKAINLIHRQAKRLTLVIESMTKIRVSDAVYFGVQDLYAHESEQLIDSDAWKLIAKGMEIERLHELGSANHQITLKKLIRLAPNDLDFILSIGEKLKAQDPIEILRQIQSQSQYEGLCDIGQGFLLRVEGAAEMLPEGLWAHTLLLPTLFRKKYLGDALGMSPAEQDAFLRILVDYEIIRSAKDGEYHTNPLLYTYHREADGDLPPMLIDCLIQYLESTKVCTEFDTPLLNLLAPSFCAIFHRLNPASAKRLIAFILADETIRSALSKRPHWPTILELMGITFKHPSTSRGNQFFSARWACTAALYLNKFDLVRYWLRVAKKIMNDDSERGAVSNLEASIPFFARFVDNESIEKSIRIFDEGISKYESISQITSTESLRMNKGMLLESIGKLNESQRVFKLLTDISDTNVKGPSLAALARIELLLEEDGDILDAIKYISQLIEECDFEYTQTVGVCFTAIAMIDLAYHERIQPVGQLPYKSLMKIDLKIAQQAYALAELAWISSGEQMDAFDLKFFSWIEENLVLTSNPIDFIDTNLDNRSLAQSLLQELIGQM